MRHKFKVGDRIRKVRVGGAIDMPLGFTATVSRLDYSVRWGDLVGFKEGIKSRGWYTTDVFELEEEFKGNV